MDATASPASFSADLSGCDALRVLTGEEVYDLPRIPSRARGIDQHYLPRVPPLAWPETHMIGYPLVAIAAAWPLVHARHSGDVIGPQLIGVWWERITTGAAGSDPSFYLLLICLLMWITGAWLSWSAGLAAACAGLLLGLRQSRSERASS